ncbi:CoA transferase [Streptomyces sp. NPDC056656]|uniref:CoA transferase n=1 Tax=Streptomyces sp. NPDC056656 TaxID=3345895 RepID=UPI003679DA90
MVDWFTGGAADVARDWARSGLLPLTGHPNGSPLVPHGAAPTFAARLGDHIGAAGGPGAALDAGLLLAERAALTGRRRGGRRSVGGSCHLLPTRDGWAAVSLARPDDPLLWSALTGEEMEPSEVLPRLGRWLAEHDGSELDKRAELLGVAGGAVRTDAHRMPLPPGRPCSVRGLLVVDFSALWAGPLCAHLLGLAGATVVKVETPTRPDGARRGCPAFYDLLHAGHCSVVLDPADPAGRRALRALVRRADVVIEASRPRALAGFGLSAQEEVARGCTWVSITALGRDSQRVGFGDDVASSRGLLATDADGAPVFCGDAVADPLTGLLAAALVMSEPEGGGRLLDVAMADVVSAALALPGLPQEGATVIAGGDSGWVLNTGSGRVPVAGPTPRTPVARAAASGADTADVLRRLGVPRP